MAEFIDEKSAKAKGKRVTTLEVASIEDITPEPEPDVSPDETGETPEEEGYEDDLEQSEQSEPAEAAPEAIEVEGVTMTFEKPADTQLDLF